MKILLVTPEAAPFAKTGGLADVAAALPRELHRLGHEVAIILPAYRTVAERFSFEAEPRPVEVAVPIAGTTVPARLRRTRLDDITVYLVEQPLFFDRSELYGTSHGDYPDNAERFGFFCRAVLQLLPHLDVVPEVLHLNDWQTGLIPVLLRTELRSDPLCRRLGTVTTIHNLGYQGLFPPAALTSLGLAPGLFSIDGLEYYGRISFLKGGIFFSDLLTTVSETYCREIQTPAYGHGFDGILRHRRRDLHGILNGLDPGQWNPSADRALASLYDADRLDRRPDNKRALQQELGLAVDPDRPLVALVTRLDRQKGLDLVLEAWPELLRRKLQLVLLGSGDQTLTRAFAALQQAHPAEAAIRLTFDDALARRIYAGSDLFLMPSRYEPCGLGQLIALRYGSVPLVRKTGGLADTVQDADVAPATGNGFTFDQATVPALLAALDRALVRFTDRPAWQQLVRRGMRQDFSWTRSAERYLDLYRIAHERRQN